MDNLLDDFMEKAIQIAQQGISKGQSPFGCCITQNNQIIAIEHNHVWDHSDITAHAEVLAIRQACQKLNQIHLDQCLLFSTCEPCPMCFSAIHWARIPTIYYGATIEDAKLAGFNELLLSTQQILKLTHSSIQIHKGLLQKKCQNLFIEWKNQNSKSY